MLTKPTTSILIFLLTFYFGQAQEMNYTGLLKLNDSLMITYEVALSEREGIVKGHSVTDFGGEHETKSLIKGRYNQETNTLSFSEYGIVYTKSPVNTNDFCYVNFVGKVKDLSSKKIEGDFKGRFEDGTTCINGELVLLNQETINEISKKVDKKIKRKKKLKKYADAGISVKKSMDTLKQSQLKSGEKLSFFSNSKNYNLILDDAGEADGDRVTISLNGKIITRNETISKDPKTIDLTINQYPSTIKISALNSGAIPPNTINIKLQDDEKVLKTLSNLKAGTSSELIIRKPAD